MSCEFIHIQKFLVLFLWCRKYIYIYNTGTLVLSLSIGVHTERCSTCRRSSWVRPLTWFESAWNKLGGARIWDRSLRRNRLYSDSRPRIREPPSPSAPLSDTHPQWSPRSPRLQPHQARRPPPSALGIFCYLPEGETTTRTTGVIVTTRRCYLS